MRNIYKLAIYVIFLASSAFAFAQSDHDDEHHEDDHAASIDAHVHGEAELLVAYEQNQLQIILHSPAGNIVGFEHSAETAEEQLAVEQARATLLATENLFSIEGADCSVISANVDMSGVESEDDHHHHDEESEHAEIMAEYSFSCTNHEISSISLLLLNVFPGIEELHAQWVTETQQGVSELSQGNINLVLEN